MLITYSSFVSKAAGPWVVVEGLLSGCRCHFPRDVKATPGQKTIHHFQLGWTIISHREVIVHPIWK
jgi:hypothetical protein